LAYPSAQFRQNNPSAATMSPAISRRQDGRQSAFGNESA
jgi:hypothetical protein